ncbi:alcohol dehydrogenase catalytic domain-containing protein, partial [Vreelandella rituensis]
MQIQAAITSAMGETFALDTVELATPALGEIQVRIVATGVCHTDAVARDLGIAPFPIVLGHEGAGVVEALGAGVKGLEVGDHVVLSFAHCGQCAHCLTGHPTVCSTFNELNFGGAMDDGSHRLQQQGKTLGGCPRIRYAHLKGDQKTIQQTPKDDVCSPATNKTVQWR